MSAPYLSRTAYATPYSVSEHRRKGEPITAELHVVYRYGKATRSLVVPLGRADLLAIIANAADALRLLDETGGAA